MLTASQRRAFERNKRRQPVMGLVESLGPESVDLGISVNFALVIGSKELGVGGGLSELPMSLFLELGDAVLEELGVPE